MTDQMVSKLPHCCTVIDVFGHLIDTSADILCDLLFVGGRDEIAHGAFRCASSFFFPADGGEWSCAEIKRFHIFIFILF